MTLSASSGFGSLWTSQSKYIIDFERGLVTHSKTLTKGQFNRLMGNKAATLRPQFNLRQAFAHYTNYFLAEKYLLFVKNAHNNQMSKMIFQASPAYTQNHKDFFQKTENQLAYPMVQMPYGGFVRTKLERQNLVNYVGKIQDKTNTYGMKMWSYYESQEAQIRTYEVLRQIAFKPRQKQQKTPIVPTQESDQ